MLTDTPGASVPIAVSICVHVLASTGAHVGACDVLGDPVTDGAEVGNLVAEPPPQTQHMSIDEKMAVSAEPQSLGLTSYYEAQSSPYGSVAPSSVSKQAGVGAGEWYEDGAGEVLGKLGSVSFRATRGGAVSFVAPPVGSPEPRRVGDAAAHRGYEGDEQSRGHRADLTVRTTRL